MRDVAVRTFLAGAVAGLVWAESAGAVDKNYIGGAGTGNWLTGSLWSPFGAPGQDDNVVIRSIDGVTRAVNFDGTGTLLLGFGEVRLYATGSGTVALHNPGNIFQANHLWIGAGGSYTKTGGNSTYVHFARLDGGSVNHTSGTFNAARVDQYAGTVTGLFHISQRYALMGGMLRGTVYNDRIFDFTGGAAEQATLINHGTFNHGSSVGSFNAVVTNHGTIKFFGSATFHSLTSTTPLELPANRSMTTTLAVAQNAGTFTQLGNVTTSRVRLHGGAWNQHSGTLTIGGMSDSVLEMGSNAGVNSPKAARS